MCTGFLPQIYAGSIPAEDTKYTEYTSLVFNDEVQRFERETTRDVCGRVGYGDKLEVQYE